MSRLWRYLRHGLMALRCASIDKAGCCFANRSSQTSWLLLMNQTPIALQIMFRVLRRNINTRTMMQTEVWETIDSKNETVDKISCPHLPLPTKNHLMHETNVVNSLTTHLSLIHCLLVLHHFTNFCILDCTNIYN